MILQDAFLLNANMKQNWYTEIGQKEKRWYLSGRAQSTIKTYIGINIFIYNNCVCMGSL